MEQTLFRVPRDEFARQSEIFKSMLELPSGPDGDQDGGSDEKPIRLEGITASDFRSFLCAFYPRYVPCVYKEKSSVKGGTHVCPYDLLKTGIYRNYVPPEQ